jgi:predicted N-acetyltransferase YhbS
LVVDTPAEPEPTDQAGQADPNDKVIDLRDADVLATGAPEVSMEGGEVVIDLRELAPTGRIIVPGPTMSGRPPDLLPNHHLVTITGGDRWMDAEAFVYDVYLKLGYTAENSRHQVEELVRFADYSRFHAVCDDDGSIVGTIRAIHGGFEDLPVGKFERIDFEDEDPMCELSSIVVDPSVRSIGIIEHLYREGFADAVRMGANAITGLGERWLLDLFRHTYGFPFVPVGIPKWYMGGEVIPMIVSLSPESMGQIESSNPEFWYWTVDALTPEEIEAVGYTSITREGAAARSQG